MKRISVFLFLMSLVLCGCSDDDDEKTFSENSLYQTQWNGKLQYLENGETEECKIYIAFETSTTGRYLSEDMSVDSYYSRQTNLAYSIENKVVSISQGVRNILTGNWWVEKYDEKSIVLKKQPNTPYEFTLTLKKL